MRYIFERGKRRRVMHIQRTSIAGLPTNEALCGIDHSFNTTVNAPWSFGRKVCARCRKIQSDDIARFAQPQEETHGRPQQSKR
jgi:hypothetical protein